MKKLLVLTLLLSSCVNDYGKLKPEVVKYPEDFIIIHNKTYKLMKVSPCESCNSIWIMYPKDSLDEIPQTINYNVTEGKSQVNETIIKVK